MKNIIYLYFLIFFVGCSNISENNQKILKETSKEADFNIGYNTARINSGLFEKNDKEYFYFFNHLYTDQISIFNKYNKKVDSIYVGTFNALNNEIIGIKFFNSDTILLRTRHNILYLINKKSELLKTFDLNNTSIFKIDSTYTIFNNMFNIGDKSAILITNYNDKNNPFKNKDDYCTYLKYFTNKSFNSNRFLFINNIYSDSILTKHTLSKFEYNYTDDNHFSMINPSVLINEPYVFIYSINSDKIFIYSNKVDSVISNFTVKSIYSKQIFTKPFKIEGECIKKLEKNAYTGENGSLLDMYYSSYTNSYYFFIRIPMREATEKDLRYSIVRYNNNFKKIGETQLFKTPKGGILWSNKGVYISNEKLNYRNKILKYKYYEFTK